VQYEGCQRIILANVYSFGLLQRAVMSRRAPAPPFFSSLVNIGCSIKTYPDESPRPERPHLLPVILKCKLAMGREDELRTGKED